ncbi:SipW-dependent-type signal peptide-containing protein [Lentibacillus sp.]|uniref:SipW-dependent-type signal peptide-containing protein n=1 Tax=Lentibacillus sp. TaxID=1925746 RepID=UPI002B4B55E1|nr:SipW-dependent-type signal peptide-containing protein [Lentibacillus sp.]HLS09215.1 SipW-dependent-type signal peptide-containing protein [Lentibacillus sp.]
MSRFLWTKRNPDVKRSIVFPLVCSYLLFLTVALLTSPTNAYFTDSAVTEGDLSAAGQFASEGNITKAGKDNQDTGQPETHQESESEQAEQRDEAGQPEKNQQNTDPNDEGDIDHDDEQEHDSEPETGADKGKQDAGIQTEKTNPDKQDA